MTSYILRFQCEQRTTQERNQKKKKGKKYDHIEKQDPRHECCVFLYRSLTSSFDYYLLLLLYSISFYWNALSNSLKQQQKYPTVE